MNQCHEIIFFNTTFFGRFQNLLYFRLNILIFQVLYCLMFKLPNCWISIFSFVMHFQKLIRITAKMNKLVKRRTLNGVILKPKYILYFQRGCYRSSVENWPCTHRNIARHTFYNSKRNIFRLIFISTGSS